MRLVLEAVTEDMSVKKYLFSKLDLLCDEGTVFASNTSSLSITEIAASLKHRENFIGMHFFNPAPVMKLVEIIRGISTSGETVKKPLTLLHPLIK